MFQSSRSSAVNEWINELRAGAPIPTDMHRGARVYFSALADAAAPGVCVVCGTPLVGRQENLCAGHWDWLLFEPLEEIQMLFNPTNALIEFLRIFVHNGFVISTDEGHDPDEGATCEVCGTGTTTRETLYTCNGGSIKEHAICPDHRTFRWEEVGT